MRHTCFLVLVAACADAGSDLAPSGPVGKGDGVCPTVPAGIAPLTGPKYSCAPVDADDAALLADINRFWGSQIIACACGPDFQDSSCVGAWSLFGTGYIYIGLDFIQGLTQGAHSITPAQYALAHEVGHEIEGRFNDYAPTTQQRELTADCLAGYYLGSLICSGQTSESDIRTTLGTACVIADGTGDPVADLQTHGTCEQRMASVVAGMQAYLRGDLPLAACAL